MNTIVIVGRLTVEPETSYTGKGTPYTTFTLADNPHKEGDEPIFRRIKAWGPLAEICEKHLHKGTLVTVAGHERAFKYESSKGGGERIGQEVVMENMEICSPKSKGEAEEAA